MTIKEAEISEIKPSEYNLTLEDCSRILYISCPLLDDWKMTADKCIEKFFNVFPSEKYTCYLWTRNLSNLTPNIIQRSQKIWNHKSMLWLKNADKSEESCHKDNNGVFYSGIAKIDENILVEAFDYTRRNWNSIFFVSDTKIKNFNEIDSFLADNEKKIEKKYDFLMSKNLIPCKVTGLFDDNEMNIIIFLNKRIDFFKINRTSTQMEN